MWLLLALALASAEAAPPPPRPADHVVLISLDGFSDQTYERYAKELPQLRSLARRGVVGSSRTVFPSVTWPAHTTLVTGVLPSLHGVVGNRWLNRQGRKVVSAWQPPKAESVRVPTIYDVVHRAGGTTAALLWPLTSGAESLDYNLPELYGVKLFRRWVTPAFWAEMGPLGFSPERLAEVSKREDVELDELIARAAERLISKYRPTLTLVHFCTGDTRGHRQGPRSAGFVAGLREYDRFVGRVVGAVEKAGIAARTAILVVSDHGFFEIARQVDVAKVLLAAGLRAKELRTVSMGHMAYVYVLAKRSRAELLARARKALQAQQGVERLVSPEGYAALGLPNPELNQTVGDLVVIAKPDHSFGAVRGSSVVGPPKYLGTHGYPPDHPANRPLFIAAGAGIQRRDEAVSLRNVDVAPGIARLLGVELPGPLHGKVPAFMLNEGP